MKLRDPRQAIHDAYALHLLTPNVLTMQEYGCRIDRSSASSADGLIVDAIEAGRIMAVVDIQAPEVRGWLIYAYPPDTLLTQSTFLQSHLFNQLFLSEPEKYRSRLYKLCDLAIYDFKIRINNGKKLPMEYIASVLGVQKQNLKRDGYMLKFRKIEELLGRYDAIGVDAVAQLINKLRVPCLVAVI